MNTTVELEQLIGEGIKGLPTEYLSEIADFVVFLRRKALEGKEYQLSDIQQELSLLDTHERQHLEEEFQDFDQQIPKE